MQIRMYIDIGQDTAAERVVFEVIDHAVHLIHHSLFVDVLYAHLIAVRLSDRTVLICPFIPDMTVQVMDIVRFFLPDPEHFIRTALDRRFPQRDRRKFFGKIIAVHHAEFFDRIGTAAVLPVRAHLFSLGAYTVCQYIPAHIDKDLIC